MPLIIKQENSSASILLDILFKLYSDPSDERKQLAESRLMNFVEKLLREYLFLENNNSLFPPIYSASKVPIVLQVLTGYLRLENSQFMKHLSRFYELFSNLVLVTIVDIRNQVRQLFIHIGKLNGFLPTSVPQPEQPAASRELEISPSTQIEASPEPKAPATEQPKQEVEVSIQPPVVEIEAKSLPVDIQEPVPAEASQPEVEVVPEPEVVSEPAPESPVVIEEEVKEEAVQAEPDTTEEPITETVINEEASHTLNGTHESVNDPQDTIESKESHTIVNGDSSDDQLAPEVNLDTEENSQILLDTPLTEEIQIEN